jgi:hypothetical protein
MDIAYGTPLHSQVLDRVRDRYMLATNRTADLMAAFDKADEVTRSYIKASDIDLKRKQERKSKGTPHYTTVLIPHSYSQMLAAHTYWSSVFLSRTPVMQFAGRHGETEESVQAVEALFDYQLVSGQFVPVLFMWLYDVAKYGRGIVGEYWEEEKRVIVREVTKPKQVLGIDIPGTERTVKERAEVPGYVGNRLYNVKPHDFYADPRVPLARFQQGEFCGRGLEVGANMLRKGDYFNVREALASRPTMMRLRRGSNIIQTPNSQTAPAEGGVIETAGAKEELRFYELVEMYVELSPSEWGLGTSTRPEKWLFTVCNGAVVVQARPLGLLHDRYPFSVLQYEMEAYAIDGRGMLEVLDPLNEVLTWLFNTHFYAVRKTLNDQLIVDPSRVELSDFTDPQGGRLIKLTPRAYGTDPSNVVTPLPVSNLTSNHIQGDARVVVELMYKLSGVNDSMMGLVNSGGRKSATEIRSGNSFGISRLKTNAEFFSATGWADLASRMLSNTQQLLDGERQYAIAGQLMDKARRFVSVTPDMIAGSYDYVPIDGTLPIDRMAMAELWTNIMKEMQSIPPLMARYDIGAVFEHVARLSGIKDLNTFRVQGVSNEMLTTGIQNGNVVPIVPPGSQAA